MPDQNSDQFNKIAAARFAEHALHYCTFVENCSELKPYDFVVQALDILATLQHEAIALPDKYNLTDSGAEVSGIDIPLERQRAVASPISDILGKRNFYLLVFDPTDYEDEDRSSAVGSSIGGDLAEIYADLQKGLLALQQPGTYSPDDILWEWKFGFMHHWGRHLANAQRTLFFIISNYMVTPDSQ